jgi:hypothetical protein
MEEGDHSGQGWRHFRSFRNGGPDAPYRESFSQRLDAINSGQNAATAALLSHLACRTGSVYPKSLQDRQIRYPSLVQTASGPN